MAKKLSILILALFFSILVVNAIEINGNSSLIMATAAKNLNLTSNAAKTVFADNGVIVCDYNQPQIAPKICPDGSGGAIIVWEDYRNMNYDLYGQRINSTGDRQWTSDGVAICIASDNQVEAQIISDGSGGAIIAWRDGRPGVGPNWYDIYAQKVDFYGYIYWTISGKAICTEATQPQQYVQLCSNGVGGAIITWEDGRGAGVSGNDIYAQIVLANGSFLCVGNGVAICTNIYDQHVPQICTDGSGGAIITWEDRRQSGPYYQIYARRINSAGTPQWASDGEGVCTAANEQRYPQICSDGAGGAIIAWEDYRNGGWDIYAQKVNSTGDPQWTPDGVLICNEFHDQQNLQICSDGSGGAIIAWGDERNAPDYYDIFAQRIDSAGVVQWTANGTEICTETDIQEDLQICSDSLGGAIIVWEDNRTVNWDIYAQKINSQGKVQWTKGGVPICSATGAQTQPAICKDESTGAIITWTHYIGDIYAQRIIDTALLGINPLLLAMAAASMGEGEFLGLSMETWLMVSLAGNVVLGIVVIIIAVKKK